MARLQVAGGELNFRPRAPSQVHVVTLDDDQGLMDYAKAIVNELRANFVRCESDFSSNKINGKIQEAEQAKVDTMLVIVGRDMDAGYVFVRVHGKGNLAAKPKGEVIAEILAAIKERRPQTFKFQTVNSILSASPAWICVGLLQKDSPAVARPRV